MLDQKKKKRKPDEKEKEEIIGILSREFREAPQDMWSCYPEIAAKLEKFLNPPKSASVPESVHYFYLTERDKTFRLNTLKAIIEKFEKSGISREESIKALEEAAALREDAALYKDTLLNIIQKVFGFSVDAETQKTEYFQKGKPEHHIYSLVRGITLSLTWDKKLIKIVLDPEEFALRQRALSFVGVGSDKQTDVAQRHNHYLEDSFVQ